FRETFPARLSALRERPAETFLWLWSLLVLLFFSVSRSKLIPYVEPVWPALAALLAIGIERARERGDRFTLARRLTGALFGLLLPGAAAWGLGAGCLSRFGAAGAGWIALAAAALGFLVTLWPRRETPDPVPMVAGPWLAFVAGLLLVLPAAARQVTP